MHVLTTVDEAEIARLRAADEFFWIDIAQPEHAEIERLGKALDLHPVALEDTIEFGQRPKLDPYDGQLLLVFYTARVPAHPIGGLVIPTVMLLTLFWVKRRDWF